MTVPKPKYVLGGDLTSAITNLSNILIMLAGSVALLFLIIAAFRMITSAGESQTIESSKKAMFYVIIGLIVVILSYTIVQWLIIQLQR